jgi:hypothetical protein
VGKSLNGRGIRIQTRPSRSRGGLLYKSFTIQHWNRSERAPGRYINFSGKRIYVGECSLITEPNGRMIKKCKGFGYDLVDGKAHELKSA